MRMYLESMRAYQLSLESITEISRVLKERLNLVVGELLEYYLGECQLHSSHERSDSGDGVEGKRVCRFLLDK